MIRKLLLRALGLSELEPRLKDIERHFVTKRNDQGMPIETLADVAIKDRKERTKPKGMTWQQRKQWLEATDGGRSV